MPRDDAALMPGFDASDNGNDQGSDPVGPPPAQRAIQGESSQCQQARGCPDAAQNAVSLQRSASHVRAQPLLRVSERGEYDQGHPGRCQRDRRRTWPRAADQRAHGFHRQSQGDDGQCNGDNDRCPPLIYGRHAGPATFGPEPPDQHRWTGHVSQDTQADRKNSKTVPVQAGDH